MQFIEKLQESLPSAARDIKINLSTVLTPNASLNAAQTWGVAIASAYTAKNPVVIEAILSEAKAQNIEAPVFEDAKAAAALMAMNNVYYRFRHIVGNEEYSQKPARLRMMRLGQVATNKADFELFCLAVSAINNCETCVKSHEATVTGHGLTTDQVHDAVRIAAIIAAAAVAQQIGPDAA